MYQDMNRRLLEQEEDCNEPPTPGKFGSSAIHRHHSVFNDTPLGSSELALASLMDANSAL
jgi:hypothetical protein